MYLNLYCKSLKWKSTLTFEKLTKKNVENYFSLFANSKNVYTQKLDSGSYFIYLNKLFLIDSKKVKLTLSDQILDKEN